MQERRKKNIMLFETMGLGLLFIALIIGLKKIDVRPIGPQDSEIGFAILNGFLKELLGENTFFYNVTEVLGIVAILVMLGFGVVGLVQLIKGRSIKAVDTEIIVLGFFYATMIIAYTFFEVFAVNYRPIIVDGELEASFPSSHTMLVICIMSTAVMQFKRMITAKKLREIATVISYGIIIVTVIGRMLSGVHWFTDILGGVLLSGVLVRGYCTILAFINDLRKTENQGIGNKKVKNRKMTKAQNA